MHNIYTFYNCIVFKLSFKILFSQFLLPSKINSHVISPLTARYIYRNPKRLTFLSFFLLANDYKFENWLNIGNARLVIKIKEMQCIENFH